MRLESLTLCKNVPRVPHNMRHYIEIEVQYILPSITKVSVAIVPPFFGGVYLST